jgi:hypothetical protein
MLCSDVLFVAAPDGSARLLDLNGSVYAIDRLGSFLLRSTLHEGRAAAVEQVSMHFSVSTEQVQRDLDEFIQQLRCRGLIGIGGTAPRGSRRRWKWESALTPVLGVLRGASLPDRVRVLCLLILARLSFALFGWSRTIAAWRTNSRCRSHADFTKSQEISEIVRTMAARHWLTTECKERALCCWTLLQWHGIESALIVGIMLYPFAGHCWCACGDEILADDSERCNRFTPLLSYR